MEKIAIQGYPGAYHEIAARLYYGKDIEIVPTDTFEDLVYIVENNAGADAGIMAIENSIAGSILPNYNLINNSHLSISGELLLRIKHNLLALPDTSLQDIKEVHSHPMAIAQCKRFFSQYPNIKLVASMDTAESTKQISNRKLSNIGSIASKLAADMYGMKILSQGIETNKHNFTRFIILDHFMNAPNIEDFNKASISFALNHEIGSLYKTLKVLSDNGANLTKIQSTPITGRPWEYLFFADFLLDNNEHFNSIIQGLSLTTKGLKILGKYKSGEHYDD